MDKSLEVLHMYDIIDAYSERPNMTMEEDTKFKPGYICCYKTPSGRATHAFILQVSHVVQPDILACMVRRHLTNDFLDQSDQFVDVWSLRWLDP